jgi:hypothetical protein
VLDWGTLTVLVVPDPQDGVMVMALPKSAAPSPWRVVNLNPRLLRTWTGPVRSTLEGGPSAETTPLSIEGARDSGPLVFIPGQPGDPKGIQLDFPGCPSRASLRIRATVENVRQLVDALDDAGRLSALGRERPADREEVGACDLDPGGEPRTKERPRLTHPLAGQPECAEGAVMLQFVIDADGRVDTSQLRVLYATDSTFVREAVGGLRDSSFRPGVQEGHPVRTRVVQRFIFKCS